MPIGLGLGFVAAMIAAVGVIAAILAIPDHKSTVGWLYIALAVCGGLGLLLAVIGIYKFRHQWHEKQEAADEARWLEEEDRREALRIPIAAVGDVDPTWIGIDAAVQTELPGGQVPTYLPRIADDELRLALRGALDDQPWIVVATGPPKTGKSRALFEALRHVGQQTTIELVAPRDAPGLRLLTRTERPRSNAIATVLWLDDLEPFVNEGVTLDALREWRAAVQGGLVAATFGGKGSELVTGSDPTKLATLAGQILQHAREIPVLATAPEELAPLRSSLSSEALASIERYGLAAYLVAAPALERKLVIRRHAPGEPETPAGVAIVYAAVDWARCGRTDPISRQTLRDIWPSYLTPDVHATEENFDAGLDWALRPVAGTIALLQQVSSYRAYEYIVRQVSDARGALTPREQAWAVAVETALDAQAIGVGVAAYASFRLDHASAAFTRALKTSVDEIAAIASLNLSAVLSELGRYEEAIAVSDELLARFDDAAKADLRAYVAIALVNRAAALSELGRGEEAVAVYEEVVERFGDDPALRGQVAKSLLNRAARLGELDRDEEAIAVCEELVERFGDEPALREQVGKALFNKGLALGGLDRDEEAIAVYEEVVEGFGDDPALREQVANALYNMGVRLGQLGRDEEAIAVYEEVVKRFGDEPALRKQVAKSLLNRAARLGELDRDEEAIAVCEELVERFGDEPALREQVGKALFNKGLVLGELDRDEEAIAVYEELERFGDEPALREQVANALVNRGVTLGQLGLSEDAIAVYEELVKRFGDEPALREQVANALVNTGVRLGQLGRREEEIAAYEQLVKRFADAAEPALRKQVARALFNKGVTLSELGRAEEAIAVYEEVVERFGDAPEPALREQVAKALVNRGVTLGRLGRGEEEITVYKEVVARFGDAPEPALRETAINVRRMLDALADRNE